MSFWSGEKLKRELAAQQLVIPYRPTNLDCASYRLSVGSQVFSTSDEFEGGGPSDAVIQVLADPPQHTLRIAPGQFAFLLTDEIVTVPKNAIALISMRAGYKFKGLINVSGFHVDPGWSGKLLFSVYNAGPGPVIVAREEPMFLIVYADLDQDSELVYDGKSKAQDSIKPELLEKMVSQVFSPMMLQRKMEDLSKKIDRVERQARSDLDIVDKSVSAAKTGLYAIGITAGLVLAAAGVFATLAPMTLGVLLAGILRTGGYEMRTLPSEGSPSTASEIPSGTKK